MKRGENVCCSIRGRERPLIGKTQSPIPPLRGVATLNWRPFGALCQGGCTPFGFPRPEADRAFASLRRRWAAARASIGNTALRGGCQHGLSGPHMGGMICLVCLAPGGVGSLGRVCPEMSCERFLVAPVAPMAVRLAQIPPRILTPGLCPLTCMGIRLVDLVDTCPTLRILLAGVDVSTRSTRFRLYAFHGQSPDFVHPTWGKISMICGGSYRSGPNLAGSVSTRSTSCIPMHVGGQSPNAVSAVLRRVSCASADRSTRAPTRDLHASAACQVGQTSRTLCVPSRRHLSPTAPPRRGTYPSPTRPLPTKG